MPNVFRQLSRANLKRGIKAMWAVQCEPGTEVRNGCPIEVLKRDGTTKQLIVRSVLTPGDGVVGPLVTVCYDSMPPVTRPTVGANGAVRGA